MTKFLYYTRKFMGPILVVIWMTIYIILTVKGYNSGSLFFIIALLAILLLSMYLYPKKKVFCRCGHKWTKQIKYEETKYEDKPIKKSKDIKTYYMHVFNCTCTCPSCKTKFEYKINANGGYDIKHKDGKLEGHKIKHTVYLQNKNLLTDL